MIENLNWKNSEDVLINNIETSAIIEDADNVLNYFADKYIITKYQIQTGDIVEYAGIEYLIISQIDRNIEGKDENKYNYRARMRQADYKIKIIIDGELEKVPAIIEGQRFDIVNEQVISLSDDKIIVTIKDDIEIEKEMRFIKLKQVWKIVGIDRTKKGLIILYCDVDLFNANDDRENEIADKDKLNPTEPEPTEPNPTEPEEPEEPISGATYSYTAQMPYPNDPDNEIWVNDSATYTIHKYIDGVEVEGSFTFEIEKIDGVEDLAEITNTTNNSVTITGLSPVFGGVIVMRAIDIKTGEIAIEKEIQIMGL